MKDTRYSQAKDWHSGGLSFAIPGLVFVGAICAYTLPALSFGEFGSASLLDIKRYYENSWLWWLAQLGIAGAGVAALAFVAEPRRNLAWYITIGCALTLPYVANLLSFLDEFGVPVSLGSGTWLAMLCFLGSTVLSWVVLRRAG